MTPSVNKRRLAPEKTEVAPPRALAVQADALFQQHSDAIHRRTDRLFAALMAGQWLAGILVALWLSPRAWAGPVSEVHLHVWAAILLGGLVTFPAVLLCLACPGRAV